MCLLLRSKSSISVYKPTTVSHRFSKEESSYFTQLISNSFENEIDYNLEVNCDNFYATAA